MFHVCLQEAEWHCDEFTKGACFSRGKSEVSTGSKMEKHNCWVKITQQIVHIWPNNGLNNQILVNL